MARELIGNIKGPQGPPGEVTNEQLEELHINVKRFGAVGDGVTDDTQAIKDAITHAESLGSHTPVYMPHGVYKTTDTIALSNPLYGHDATINYNGTDTALVVGDESAPKIVTTRKKFSLPRVVNRLRGSDGWDGTSVGVKCVNLNTCEIYVPFVQDFETGLLMYGYSQGCSYNTINLGALWENHVNILMDSDDTGWCNQSLFLNGRLQQSLTKGAVENDPDSCQIKLGKDGSRTSNNTFINTSIEGRNVGLYRMDIAGSYNHFYNLRMENHSEGNAKVFYRDYSVSNKIMGGYHSKSLEEVFETATTEGGMLDDGTTPFIKATLKSGTKIPTGSDYHFLTDMNVESHRVKYNPVTGEFILKPGRWYVEVKATFGTASGGALYIRLLRGSSVRSSQVARPDANYQFGITCSTIDVFDETAPLKVEVRQSTTTEELTLNSGQFTTVIAHYLGGL